ncbi:MAG TPA: RdgB/HAM1 family non-canonical purine NTP pyrophosphatase [Pyrinomonadaceae bacterium]|nr:RdgB/HAM1 family non-canonical purine NTP pyrophosphatase [Pyrinomonadaceae bacterium]
MEFPIRFWGVWLSRHKICSGELAVNAPRHLLLATSSEGKRGELRQLLSDLPMSLFDLRDFPAVERIAETGNTFVENASLKAIGYATQTGLVTLADDSGLEVDALGGAPGVRSARYAGESTSESKRIEALLAALAFVDESKRSARFVSALVIADSNGKILNVSVGRCEGRIALAPRGTEGFGYDPVFIPNGYGLTFAELKAEIKNQISHRAIALSAAREYLQNLTAASGAD